MEHDDCNEVRLVGRVSGDPSQVELPSGDHLTSFKLVVERGPSRRPVPAGVRQPTVDTFDCVAWTAALQRAAGSWVSGDRVEVTGHLRRRFWRAPTGAVSRTEVEVLRARRLSRAA